MVVHFEIKTRYLFLSKSLHKMISDFLFEVCDPKNSPAINDNLSNRVFLSFEEGRGMEEFRVVICYVETI